DLGHHGRRRPREPARRAGARRRAGRCGDRQRRAGTDGRRSFPGGGRPGVPREMRRMLDEQVIPRLLKLSGIAGVTRLKRFHSYGIGESRADELLAGIPGLAIDGEFKLGFQAHYPQLETKLAARGEDEATLSARLAPVEAEVRRRLGNFIVAEDNDSLE